MVKDLTQGNPTRLIIAFAWSILASSILGYVYGMTDSLMVGWYVSTDALGAIGSAAPFSDMIQGFVGSAISGFALLAGRTFGSGDHQRLRKLMANVIYIGGGMVLVATLISTVFCRTFVSWMNTPEGFVDLATSYLSVIMLGMPISAVSWICGAMFRALGDSKTPLMISALCGALNVFFNFLLLAVFPMGIVGAAWGTLCASLTGAILYLICFRRRMQMLHFGRADAGFSMPIVRQLLADGLPLGLLNSVISIGALILQIAINGHGESVVTGINIGTKLLGIVWMIIQSFESAVVYFCAQNIGAGRVDRVRSAVRRVLLVCIGIGGLCAALSIFFGRYFYMLYVGENEELIRYASTFIFIQMIFFPFMATLSIWRGGLKGIGKTMPAVMCGVIELICRLVVSFLFSDQLMLLFFAGPAAWVMASIYLGISFPRVLRSKEKSGSSVEAAPAQEKESAMSS